ncbi:MAG: hypothetical protein HYU51_19150 [Candidatus Rokubacteria bacterium]|nr:hypothetical protein [Candidatus Rokubacteria bacterium]
MIVPGSESRVADAVEHREFREAAHEPGWRRTIPDDAPRESAVVRSLKARAPRAGRGEQRSAVRGHRVDVEDLASGQDAPLPLATVGDGVLAAAGREAAVLEWPVEEPIGDDGIAGVLTEEVALVAGGARPWIVAVDVGGVVVGELQAVDEPQSRAVPDERRHGRPRADPDDGDERLEGERARRHE